MDATTLLVGFGTGTVVGGIVGFLIARGELSALRTLVSKSDAEKEKFEQKIQAIEADALKLQREIARLETEKKASEEKIEQQKADLASMQEKFSAMFENLAHRIFEDKIVKFKRDSEEGLDKILAPFKERVTEFQKKIDDSFGTQAKEQHSLKEQIERMVRMNAEMSAQTENLTKALKGDTKTQGNWGEMVLEKILEDSGLRAGTDFTVQSAGMGLENAEGSRIKPDIVVNLPENKHILIDSKVSLTHYEQYIAAATEGEREAALKLFTSSLKTHVTGLAQKNYASAEKLNTPDYVLMFVPIEGAYALAVQADPRLMVTAWEKQVVIVCPSTLFAVLRTVASIWRMEQQNRNTLEIAKQGGLLYDKFVGFVADMQEIGARLDKAKDAYGNAMSKLSDGAGSLMKRADGLRKLGVKTQKILPANLMSGDQADAQEENAQKPDSGERAA